MSWYPDTNNTDFSQQPLQLPTRPTSQKAATMPVEPEEEKINLLLEFCPGLDKVQAVRYLKV